MGVATRQTTARQRANVQRSRGHPAPHATAGRSSSTNLLQRSVGNRAIARLLESRPRVPSRTIQTKLTVSHPEDQSEREADRIADQVMRMPKLSSPKETHSSVPLDRHCNFCEDKLQRKPDFARDELDVLHTSDQPVQMQGAPKQTENQKMATGDPATQLLPMGFQQSFQKSLQQYFRTDEIKKPMVEKLATGYLNRPHKMEIPDRVIPNTPYGGDRVISGVHDPSYQEVYNATYQAIDIDELVKDKWDWKDASVRKKSKDEKLVEIGTFAAEEFILGKLQDAVVKTSISWATKESILVTVTFTLAEAEAATAATLFAIELIGIATLALSLYELANSINAPAEMSPYEVKNANIAASVKTWWLMKQTAADLKERLNKPFKPFKVETNPAVRSTTRIGP